MKSQLPIRVVALATTLISLVTRAGILVSEGFPVAYGEGTLLGTDNAVGGFNAKWSAGNSGGSGNWPACATARAVETRRRRWASMLHGS